MMEEIRKAIQSSRDKQKKRQPQTTSDRRDNRPMMHKRKRKQIEREIDPHQQHNKQPHHHHHHHHHHHPHHQQQQQQQQQEQQQQQQEQEGREWSCLYLEDLDGQCVLLEIVAEFENAGNRRRRGIVNDEGQREGGLETEEHLQISKKNI